MALTCYDAIVQFLVFGSTPPIEQINRTKCLVDTFGGLDMMVHRDTQESVSSPSMTTGCSFSLHHYAILIMHAVCCVLAVFEY